MSPTQATSPARETTHAEYRSDFGHPPSNNHVDNYSVKIATTMEGIEALLPVWRKWAHSLDSDTDYFLHTLTHDPDVLCPYVIAVLNHGIAQAMLLGQVRWSKTFAVVSSVNIPGPKARVLKIKKGGRIGRPSAEVDRLLALELLKATKSGQVDSICCERLPLHSGLFHQIQQLAGFLVNKRVPHLFSYSMLSLSADHNKRPRVFPGKVYRENRRRAGILNRAFPGQVRTRCFSQPDEMDAGMLDAARVAITTWQHHLSLTLSNTEESRETFRFFARKGWLRIYVLYVKDEPCAFLVGQLYNNTFYCQFAGYQPSFARFAVGSLLTARAFEELAAAGVEWVDLGEGDQEHYRQLGCQVSEEGTVHVYSPTLRGLCLNMFFGTTQAVRRSGRRTQSTLQLHRLSKIWRQYLFARRRSRVPSTPSDQRVST
jgi:Acetyltransferase (GNAT) domain